MKVSDCCGEPMRAYVSADPICPKCLEHCEVEDADENDYEPGHPTLARLREDGAAIHEDIADGKRDDACCDAAAEGGK